MAQTLTQVRRRIVTAMAENLTTVEIDDAVNESIEAFRDTLLVKEEPQTIALVAGTYAYSLSTAAPLAVIFSVDIDNEPLPPAAWWIIEGTAPLIVLNAVLLPSLSGTLRIQGLGIMAFVSSPGDFIGGDTDAIVLHACALLHGTRLNRVREQPDSAQLAAVHESKQSRFALLAQQAVERAEKALALPPDARRVRSLYLQ